MRKTLGQKWQVESYAPGRRLEELESARLMTTVKDCYQCPIWRQCDLGLDALFGVEPLDQSPRVRLPEAKRTVVQPLGNERVGDERSAVRDDADPDLLGTDGPLRPRPQGQS